jgi:hypothetical protein
VLQMLACHIGHTRIALAVVEVEISRTWTGVVRKALMVQLCQYRSLLLPVYLVCLIVWWDKALRQGAACLEEGRKMLHVECRYLTTVLLAYDRNSGLQLIVSHGDREEYLGKSAKYKYA